MSFEIARNVCKPMGRCHELTRCILGAAAGLVRATEPESAGSPRNLRGGDFAVRRDIGASGPARPESRTQGVLKMRPSPPPPVALLAVLLLAIFLVLFRDILAISAAADPIPTSLGAVLVPISPSGISRPYSHSSFRISSRLLNGNGQPIPRGSRRHPATSRRHEPNTGRRIGDHASRRIADSHRSRGAFPTH